MYPLKVHLNPNVIKGSIKENCSSNSLCINPTLTTTGYAITPKIFIYIHTRGVGAKEKKYFSASVLADGMASRAQVKYYSCQYF